MEENKMTVPYVAYESVLDRADRRDKRNMIIIILLIVLLVISNLVWIVVWNQYDYLDDYSVEVDSGEGDINYIGNDGDINNGQTGGTEKEI